MRAIGLLILSLVLSCFACSRNPSKSNSLTLEPHSGNQDSVGFDIASVERSPNQWLGSYTSGGKTAKFIIDLGPAKAIKEKDFQMSSGSGRFLSQSGSEPESSSLIWRRRYRRRRCRQMSIESKLFPSTMSSSVRTSLGLAPGALAIPPGVTGPQ